MLQSPRGVDRVWPSPEGSRPQRLAGSRPGGAAGAALESEPQAGAVPIDRRHGRDAVGGTPGTIVLKSAKGVQRGRVVHER